MSRTIRTTTVAATALLLAACGATVSPGHGPTPEQRLMDRPTFEQASQEYLTMLIEMRVAMSHVAPNLHWEKDPYKDGGSLCEPPYTKIRGATHSIFNGDPQGPIPDTAWPAVVKAVSAIGAKYRFTRGQSMIDAPGDHRLVLHDDWNGTVELGSVLDSSLRVYSPCLLTEGGKNLITHFGSSTPA